MNRLLSASALVAAALALCGAQWLLLRHAANRQAASEPATIRAAETRMIDAYTVLAAARDALPLSEADRAELRESDPLRTGFIGLALTDSVTTDGSLPAKQLSTDPAWVGLIARMLRDCPVDENRSTVWIGTSGSFPALTIASILACEAEGLRPIVIPSMTASTYGATIPGLDYLRIESLLHNAGLIQARSIAASIGGEGDRGIGLDPREIMRLRTQILNENVELIDALTLDDSAEARLSAYRWASGAEKPVAFINIGGNAANIGPEREASRLSPGLNSPSLLAGTAEELHGVASRLLGQGVPVIHLLNLERLRTGLDAAAPVAASTRDLDLLRRGLASFGLLLLVWWTATRLAPPALGPLILTPGPFPEGKGGH